MVARMLNGLGGRFKSFKLGATIGSSRPNPYGIVVSFEFDQIIISLQDIQKMQSCKAALNGDAAELLLFSKENAVKYAIIIEMLHKQTPPTK